MKKILLILSLSFMLAGEMEVDGDLNVSGDIQSPTIAQLQEIIAQLQAQIAAMQDINEGLSNRVAFIEHLLGIGDLPLSISSISVNYSGSPDNYGHEIFASLDLINFQNIVGIAFNYQTSHSSTLGLELYSDNIGLKKLTSDGNWVESPNWISFTNTWSGEEYNDFKYCPLDVNGDTELNFIYDGNPPMHFNCIIYYTTIE